MKNLFLGLSLVVVVGVLAMLQSVATILAAPPLQLPWPTGVSHRIAGGNTYNCGTHNLLSASTSTSYNADYYAIDFQFGLNELISATSGGTVLLARDVGDGYGNKVVVDHGGGYVSVYAHLNGFAVAELQIVTRGQLVGYAGGSGGYQVHLHFHMQSGLAAFKPEPMSGVSGFGAYGFCTGVTSPYWTSASPYANFQTYLLHTSTPLGKTGSNFEFAMGKYNSDGTPDLIAVKKNGTGSGKTEVHILSGTSNFQAPFLLQTGTALGQTYSNVTFEAGDLNRDGVVDLYAIAMNGTGSGYLELHILNGATNYGTFLNNIVTPQGAADSTNWAFAVSDYNGDGKPDVWVIRKDSAWTEVHILSGAGATPYQTYLLHQATGSSVGNFAFEATDYDGNAVPDLWAIKTNNTGSGKTEAHILSGSGSPPLQAFVRQTATAQGVTDLTNWSFPVADYNRDFVPDLNIIFKQGTTSTEAHVLSG